MGDIATISQMILKGKNGRFYIYVLAGFTVFKLTWCMDM